MKNTFLISSLILVLASCNSTENKKEKTIVDSTKAKTYFTASDFGTVDGNKVVQYMLTNDKGMVVKILNYGGTITNILVPDKNGEIGDVVLGFDSIQGYLQKENPYFGCLVGRYGNRIANGQFTLDGKTYHLAKNNNGNSLHGGIKGFDKRIWELKSEDHGGDPARIVLHYLSKDGEEGYPGNLDVTVTYSLNNNNELKIDYTAFTDKATPVNLTNHSYFNLSLGRDSTILNHEVMIRADKYTEVNDQLIPTGQLPAVKNTPMDFTAAKKVGKEINKVKGGYDHNWVLNKSSRQPELAASVYDPGSGRYMEVLTTQPGIQFYTGNFLDGKLTGKGGKKYVQHAALALETQHFPDSPNQPSFPNSIIRPGEIFHHITIYKFSTK